MYRPRTRSGNNPCCCVGSLDKRNLSGCSVWSTGRDAVACSPRSSTLARSCLLCAICTQNRKLSDLSNNFPLEPTCILLQQSITGKPARSVLCYLRVPPVGQGNLVRFVRPRLNTIIHPKKCVPTRWGIDFFRITNIEIENDSDNDNDNEKMNEKTHVQPRLL